MSVDLTSYIAVFCVTGLAVFLGIVILNRVILKMLRETVMAKRPAGSELWDVEPL